MITSFGDNGSVHLTQGHGREVPDDDFDQTSPPVVFEDIVIVGSRVPDRVQRRFDTPGSVQAFDARTGERRWIFFTVPQSNDAFGADTWEDQSWRYTGHANVWGLMSLDEERGLLYVPTSTPSSDYWGGRRPGANLFAESLLCLDARTGERQWHFQAVHHGLWDYDFTSPPNLVTINVDGPGDRRGGRGVEAGLHVRLRPGERRAGVAHRRASGRHDHRRPGRGGVSDAAVPDEAAAVRGTGRVPGRRQRPDAGDQRAGARGDEPLPARPALHAARAARHAAAARA